METPAEGGTLAADAAPTTCTEDPCSSKASGPLNVVFDMETGDPDDVLTLLFLCSNPRVQLCAVTLTPGSREQVSLVRWLLQQVGAEDVRVGAQEWPRNAEKQCMQGRFYRSFGRLPVESCEAAEQLLCEVCGPEVTLLTGGPVHNLGAALRRPGFQLGRWVAQGGFAGEGVVPRELQMAKFAGKQFCATWNFNGNVQAAEAALASASIARRVLVSKNVCHSVTYESDLHDAIAREALAAHDKRRATALRLVHRSMADYGMGKKLHDPLALAVALEESVCALHEVDVRRNGNKSEWGSVPAPGSNTWISVDYNKEAFHEALLALAPGSLAKSSAGPDASVPDMPEAPRAAKASRWRKGKQP